MRVLHVLDHSLPEQSGYAYRSHAILRELKRRGLSIDVVTSPKHGPVSNAVDKVDGVEYQRTVISDGSSTSGVAGQVRTVRRLRAKIAGLLKQEPVDIIHAHSPCLNGLASFGHGVPLVYEMRSSWEDAAVSVGTTAEGSVRYRISRALENQVVHRADSIVVICEGLKRELLARGVPSSRITIVPNALPQEMFELPDARSIAAVKERHNLHKKNVIGFFGSFFEWEGVDDLVRGLPEIIAQVPNVHLLLAGGGRQEDELKALVSRNGLEDHVTFAGRIGHDEVSAYYGAVDVMVFPRVSDRLTNMVTPIKPIEAMAQNSIVVASDVGGHKELIEDGKSGFLFRAGDCSRMVQAIVPVLESASGLEAIRTYARKRVESERRWSIVAEQYMPLYERYE